MTPNKKMSETLIYFIILGAGTILVFSAGVYDKRVKDAKESAREAAATKAEGDRKVQADKDKAEMIRVVVAARAVQQQAQHLIDQKSEHPTIAVKSFTSVDAALQDAIGSLATDTAKELEAAQKTLASQNAWRREVQKWNNTLDPQVIAGLKTIEDTLQKASAAVGQFSIQKITKQDDYRYSFGWDLDKTPDTTDLLQVEFSSGSRWSVKAQRGYVGYKDADGIPRPLQSPCLFIRWDLPTGAAASCVFYFEVDGRVTIQYSEQMFPGGPSIKEKYKDNGPELIANMVVEMLRRVNVQGLTAEATKAQKS